MAKFKQKCTPSSSGKIIRLKKTQKRNIFHSQNQTLLFQSLEIDKNRILIATTSLHLYLFLEDSISSSSNDIGRHSPGVSPET